MRLKTISIIALISTSLSVNAQSQKSSESNEEASKTLFELPPFERAVCCIRFYEGLHRKKDYPYVGYGHKLRPGERYSSHMTAREAEELLRKDLRELCAMFRSYGQDSLLLSEISDNNSYPNQNIIPT